MKKIIIVLLALLLCISFCFGKGKSESPEIEVNKTVEAKWTPDNDILTYERIDPTKTQLVISRTGNLFPERLLEGFNQAYPQIQTIYIDITGGDTFTVPVLEWLENGLIPDVMFFTVGNFIREKTYDFFQDLSSNELLLVYHDEALMDVSHEGKFYMLPGPASMNCMVYNKTLFEQYGWKVPDTFDEFVKLCVQIREDTDGEIEPWNPNAKYDTELILPLEGFTYSQTLAGLQNRIWLHDLLEGKVSYSGHMDSFYDAVQTLIDNKIIVKEHFTFSATTRGILFEQGKIAMINKNVTTPTNNPNYEFGYFPFPGKTENDGYLNSSISYYVGLPITQHSAEVQDAAKKFVEYVSTPEAQLKYIGNSFMISQVRGVSKSTDSSLESMYDAINNGRLFSPERFDVGGVSAMNIKGTLLRMVEGTMTGKQVMEEVDATIQKTLLSPNTKPTVFQKVGEAGEDFSILETSQLFADMFREKADADIGLVINNQPLRGNLMRIFKGELTESNLTVLLPRSLPNNTKLIKVSMTGSQIISALNDPWDSKNCIYAFSGLKCTVAPWNPLGSKMLSVALADGTPLVADKLYTVAFWDKTVNENYITEVLESVDGSFQEMLKEKIELAGGTIYPSKDDRITLVWD